MARVEICIGIRHCDWGCSRDRFMLQLVPGHHFAPQIGSYPGLIPFIYSIPHPSFGSNSSGLLSEGTVPLSSSFTPVTGFFFPIGFRVKYFSKVLAQTSQQSRNQLGELEGFYSLEPAGLIPLVQILMNQRF